MMTPENKLTCLSILSRLWWKTPRQAELETRVIETLMSDLTPRDELPLTVTEVYRDKPHIQTTHQNWPDAMGRIEKVRNSEGLYKVHVVRGGEIEYTWESAS